MSLFDRFRRKQQPSDEQRAFPSGSVPPPWALAGRMDAGEPVSEHSALQFAAVHSCVRLLADSISALPLDAYRVRDGIRTEIDPTPALIRRPFSMLTNTEWLFQLVTSLALRGNSYHLVTARDHLEYATELEPLHPDEVFLERDRAETGVGFPDRLIYRVRGQRVPTEDIMHVRRFTLPGSALGLSPIEAASQSIGLGLAADRYGARWFRDSANPSSVLEADGDLTEEQAVRTQKSWVDSHGGKRRPAVLSGGLKYRPISITPEESQFLETRKFQRGEIAMLYGVPPHMIGDTEKSTSWGTGIEQQSIGFVRYTLRPWLTMIESALSDQLPRGQFVKFNIDALLRGDTKTRYESYRLAREVGLMNADEIRALEDLPPIPDGNGQDYLQPLNYGPLGSDPLAAKQAEPTEPTSTDEGSNDAEEE